MKLYLCGALALFLSVVSGEEEEGALNWEDKLVVPNRYSSPTESSVNCTGIPDGTYLPDLYNCDIYYICVTEVPITEFCPAGLQFNPDSSRCVLPANMPPSAPCLQTPPPSSSTTEDYTSTTYSPICNSQPDGTYVPHPSNCELYFICFAGEATSYYCPHGLYFNPSDDRCELPELLPPSTPCLQNPVNKCQVSADGTYLPNPSDCQSYYVCLNGTANQYGCPPGLYFNPQTYLCVVQSSLPPDVPCSPFSTTVGPSTISTPYPVSGVTGSNPPYSVFPRTD